MSRHMAFPDWLAHRAAVAPEHPALIAGGRTWSFADLDAEVTRAAGRLAGLGAGAGDRVATLLPNGLAQVVLAHAVLRIGATLVPLNVRLGGSELAWQVGNAAPRVIIAEESTSGALEECRRQHGAIPVVDSHDPAPPPAAGAAHLRLVHEGDHVLAVIYTSGTTGRPKGAMLTVSNFWWSAVGSALNLGTRADDRWLACLPLFHVGGLSIVLRAAIYGITVVVHDSFDPAAVNHAIDEQRVTIVSVVAAMLQRMLDESGEVPYPRSLRCVLLGGGPAPPALLDRCAALGVPVAQTYGLTETASQVATLAPGAALRKRGSVGQPLYPNAIRITRADGSVAGPEEPGEIHVRGPIVMAGYLGHPGGGAGTLVDGWLHTGDVGRVDADGDLYVLDRRDDLIITGGENVYPAEVEAALLAHPWVAEAAVVGVVDERWGQRVIALVRLSGAADVDPQTVPEVLRTHCRSLLASYKTPASVQIVADALPRTAAGKLRRSELREMFGATAP